MQVSVALAGTTTPLNMSPPPAAKSDSPVRPGGGEEVFLHVLLGLVPCGRVIRNPGRHRGVDGCGHGTILEVRLAEEPQVVDDHVRAGVDQALDGVDHVEAARRPAEQELRARCDVVHDLEECRAFVAGASLAAEVVRDLHVREIVRGLRILHAVDAVRDDAYHHAGSVEALRPERVGAARRVALRRDATRADHGPVDGPDGAHPREAGERIEGARVHARLDAAARQLDALDPHACLLQLLQLGGAEGGAIEVDLQTPVGGERWRCGDESIHQGPHGGGRKKPGADFPVLGVRCACRTDVVELAEHAIEQGGSPR
jgi:hypothetical protein